MVKYFSVVPLHLEPQTENKNDWLVVINTLATYGSIKCNPEGTPLPGIIRWGIIFCAKSPTLGDIDLSNRPWGSGWGTEWGTLVAPLNSYVNTI